MSAKIRKYTLAEQVAIVEAHAKQGAHRVYALLNREHDLIVELAINRLRMGYAVYGDSMFHQTPDELKRETIEELADAVNRQAQYSHLETVGRV